MKIVLFGATGLLGKALLQELKTHEVVGLSSKEADIRDPQQVARVLSESRPEWVILSAAYTNVDGCETNRELAFEVNTQGAVNVGEAAKASGARLMFVSTDYVFDGRKHSPYEVADERRPINVYGQTKAQAEEKLLAMLPDCCIVRTSWLYGTGGVCFPRTILKLATERPEIKVVDDQRGSPTYVNDLSRAMYALCEQKAAGIVHVTNAGDCTWFDFATAIVRQAGLDTAVVPTTTDAFPRPAPRPRYSVLSNTSLSQRGILMPAWQEGLHSYLGTRVQEE